MADRLSLMALRGPPDHRPEATAIEVSAAQVRPHRARQIRAEPWAQGDPTGEVARQLLERRKLTAQATNVRNFGAEAEGKIVSFCELYSDGAIAQVEDVGTLEAYRGRGFARAVVQTAVDAAIAGGHELIFIIADDSDWPKELYGRMGFDAIGFIYEFTRSPGPSG